MKVRGFNLPTRAVRLLKTGLLLALVAGPIDARALEFGAEVAPWGGQSLNGRTCSSFPNASRGFSGGGLDYNRFDPSKPPLRTVEQAHFTPQVEALKGGKSTADVLDDLNYTLRSFPNHHRALYAIIRYYTQHIPEEQRIRMQEGQRLPPECYLQRAMNFRSDDHKVPLLYGLYLHRIDRLDQAERMYRRALEIQPSSAEAAYNLGLLLVDREDYSAAKQFARKAYDMGYPLNGLRKRLRAAGHPLE